MPGIDLVKDELCNQFPEYSFFISWRITERCIVAKNTKYSGADIFVKKENIIVEPAIPEWKTGLILGAGAAYKKLYDPNFSIPAVRIVEFLKLNYKVRLRN